MYRHFVRKSRSKDEEILIELGEYNKYKNDAIYNHKLYIESVGGEALIVLNMLNLDENDKKETTLKIKDRTINIYKIYTIFDLIKNADDEVLIESIRVKCITRELMQINFRKDDKEDKD